MERPRTLDAWDVPCTSRAVDGFVRIGMGGVAWGVFMGSYDAAKEGHKGPSRALYVGLCDCYLVGQYLAQAKSMIKNGLGWGIFAGTYVGLSCGVESMRRKRDWVNACVAGAATGAMASVTSGSGVKILGTAAATAAVATAGDYFLRPAQYPPTGI